MAIVSGGSWLERHERIVIVFLVLLTVGWLGTHYLNNAAAHATIQERAEERAVTTAEQTAAKNAVSVEQVTQQYQALVQTLSARNASLAVALTTRRTAVATQQHTDVTLATPVLATHIATLANAPDGSVIASGDNISLARPGAVAVAQSLEAVPELQANLTDETTIATNTQDELDKANTLIVAQGTQITDLNTTAVKKDTECKDEIKVQVTTARKSKFTWFKRGLVVGFIAGFFSGHAL
jgi:hypothetical protein